MSIDNQAMQQGYDDGYFRRERMTYLEYTGGNPGYNSLWGSYNRGYDQGAQDRTDGVDPLVKVR